jgi:hypothetical protein
MARTKHERDARQADTACFKILLMSSYFVLVFGVLNGGMLGGIPEEVLWTPTDGARR